jgi:outer membrane protein assembly factor BamB
MFDDIVVAHIFGSRLKGEFKVALKENNACFISLSGKAVLQYITCLFVLFAVFHTEASSSVSKTQDLVEASGIKGGVVVYVGESAPEQIASLDLNDRYLIQALDTDAGRVASARYYILDKGLYGKYTVEEWDRAYLPYADNIVNLLIVEGQKSKVENKEIMRVLAPRGVAYVNGKKVVKPVPPDIDDWSHYLHGPDNNAVAEDTVVGPPRRLQWQGGPRWGRNHDHMNSFVALVSAGGRIFYIQDEGPRATVQMPAEWRVVSRDAFNGKLLWKRDVTDWWPHMWINKGGHVMQPRRIVADDERIYVTLKWSAPLVALDAATGETVRTYENTEAAEEVILSEGVLFAVVQNEVTKPAHPDTDVYYKTGEKIVWDPKQVKAVKAVEAATGRELWSFDTTVVPMTISVDKERVYFHNGDVLVALNRTDGKLLWTSKPILRAEKYHVWFAPILVVKNNVVLFAGGEKVVKHNSCDGSDDTMTAVDAKTGKFLWSAPHPASGYDSPEDLFVIDDVVWTAPLSQRKQHKGVFTGRDLITGKFVNELPPKSGGHMPHHRCHRAKATSQYLITSITGMEFIDIGDGKRSRNDWARGTCLYGLMPANGLIYAPPHPCACYIVAKMSGFCAFASQAQSKVKIKQPNERLEKGAAYGKVDNQQSAMDNSSDWPTYRHDNERSGSVTMSVPASLSEAWTVKIGGRLSSMVAAGKHCYVSAIDQHTVYALYIDTGKQVWRYVAGGRVDSPPSVKNGCVVFGSRDGYVYCLHETDGRLIWKYQAAPGDHNIVAFEQLESSCPVHGSVLIFGNEVHCVAGRSMFLDGGMRYLRLDLHTGKLVSETVMDNINPETGKALDAGIRWPNLPVALPDILSCDGKNIYMRSQPFDLQGKRTEVKVPGGKDQAGAGAHLYSPTGFLDGDWFHRSYWVYAKNPGSGAFGWYGALRASVGGRMMVFDGKRFIGFKPNDDHLNKGHNTTWIEYELVCSTPAAKSEENSVKVQPASEKKKKRSRTKIPAPWNREWSVKVPVLVRGMVLTDKVLFIAGPRDTADEKKLAFNLTDPEHQQSAREYADHYYGRKGGLFQAVSADDGRKLSELKLASPPVFDGLITAQQRIFISLMDGSVICLSGGGS